MMDFNITEIRKRVEGIAAANKKEIEEAEAAVRAAEAEVDEAIKQMENAVRDADPKAYGKAKQKQQEARDAIEMYSKRADRLKKESCIPESEAKEIQRAILDGLKEENKACELKLGAMLAALLPEIDRMSGEITEGNKALEVLQNDCVKHKDGTVRVKGSAFTVSPFRLRFNDFGVAELGRLIRNHRMYKNQLGAKENKA